MKKAMSKKAKVLCVIGGMVVIVLAVGGFYYSYKGVKKVSGSELMKQGEELKNAGKYAEATEKYKAALDALNDDKEAQKKAQVELGTLYLNQQQYVEAKGVLQNVADQDTSDSFVMNNLGNAYRNSGDNNRAVEYYKKALDAGNMDSLKNLVTVLNIQGNYDQSIKYLNQYIAQYPNDADLKMLLTSTEYKKENAN